MKKFYSLLTMLLAVMSLSAQYTTEDIPFTFCLYIEDPALCYVQDSNGDNIQLVAGENVFETLYHQTTYPDGSSYGYLDSYNLYLNSDKQGDYQITGCTVDYGSGRVPYEGYYRPSTYLNLTTSLTIEMNGCTLYPEIASLESLRVASATVIVDDASKVRLECGYNGYVPTLVDGENTIKFDPANESSWSISPATYGEYLGGVTVNGIPQNERYNSYYIQVATGDVVEINTQASTAPCNVTFSFANEGTEGAISAVYTFINYERQPVDNWQAGFQIDSRGEIIVVLDMNRYNITSLTLNGEAQQLYSPELYLGISMDSEIAVTAVPYSTYDIKLTLTDPQHVVIGAAESPYSGTSELTGLVAGTQTVSLSEKMSYLIINNVSGAVIDKVTYTPAGGEPIEVEPGYSGYYVPVEAGTAVDVVSHMIQRDAEATLWINDIDKMYMMYMEYADGSGVFNTYGPTVPVTGDQTFKFDPASDNPFNLYYSPKDYETPGYVTVNGQLVEPQYEGSTNYQLTLANGDVVKIFACEVYSSGVEGVSVDAADGAAYDMMGRKVNGDRLAPGIYIINGKKILK